MGDTPGGNAALRSSLPTLLRSHLLSTLWGLVVRTPVLAIDVATGFVYTGMGLQRTPTGGAASPQDLFRTSISFYDTPAVAGLCGGLAVPVNGVGLVNAPPLSLVPLTLSGPFLPRQQGGLYVVSAFTQNVATTLTFLNSSTTTQAVPSALVVYGGRQPAASLPSGDVWYSANQSVFLPLSVGAFNSEAYGPATCVDQYKQILYSIGPEWRRHSGH